MPELACEVLCCSVLTRLLKGPAHVLHDEAAALAEAA